MHQQHLTSSLLILVLSFSATAQQDSTTNYQSPVQLKEVSVRDSAAGHIRLDMSQPKNPGCGWYPNKSIEELIRSYVNSNDTVRVPLERDNR